MALFSTLPLYPLVGHSPAGAGSPHPLHTIETASTLDHCRLLRQRCRERWIRLPTAPHRLTPQQMTRAVEDRSTPPTTAVETAVAAWTAQRANFALFSAQRHESDMFDVVESANDDVEDDFHRNRGKSSVLFPDYHWNDSDCDSDCDSDPDYDPSPSVAMIVERFHILTTKIRRALQQRLLEWKRWHKSLPRDSARRASS